MHAVRVVAAVTSAFLILAVGSIALAVGGPNAMMRELFGAPFDVGQPWAVFVVIVALSVLLYGLAPRSE